MFVFKVSRENSYLCIGPVLNSDNSITYESYPATKNEILKENLNVLIVQKNLAEAYLTILNTKHSVYIENGFNKYSGKIDGFHCETISHLDLELEHVSIFFKGD